jgi:hypothetical protein
MLLLLCSSFEGCGSGRLSQSGMVGVVPPDIDLGKRGSQAEVEYVSHHQSTSTACTIPCQDETKKSVAAMMDPAGSHSRHGMNLPHLSGGRLVGHEALLASLEEHHGNVQGHIEL